MKNLQFARRAATIGALSTALVAALFATQPAEAAKAKKPPRPPVPLATTPVVIPPIVFRDRTLVNGLRVISSESHASPTVSVQVWYRVGSKDDPQGRSGFAHLFEHMMFKSTKFMKAEQFDRLTEDVGGANNASTGDDTTEYHEVVPSNHLERLLWAEAERMANLKVDEANFKSERAVVEEEYRQRILAEPYGRFFNAISAQSYAVHPYKRPTIGNIDELEASSLDDVRRFHDTFYRPDNAVLVVAGDFDPAQLDAWVDKDFAPIARPADPVPRVTAVEPARKTDKRVTENAPAVPLPAVAVTWLAPRIIDADVPALRVAAALLASGESSRLNQALVYRAQIAQQVGFEADLRTDTGLLTAYAIAAGGKRVEDVTRALETEITNLADKPVPPAELDKIKTQMLTGALLGRQTPEGIGMALASATVLEGDPQRVNTELPALQAVTAADVQRVMRTWITGARKVTIDYKQGAAQ